MHSFLNFYSISLKPPTNKDLRHLIGTKIGFGTHLEGGDALQDYYDQKDAVSMRKRLAEQLKKEGLTDFKIALVLNTTEYQIKKMRKDL